MTVDGKTILYRNGNKSSEMNRFPYRQLLAEDTQEVIQNIYQQMQVLRQEIIETERELGELQLEEKKLNDNRKQIESQVRDALGLMISNCPCRFIILALRSIVFVTRKLDYSLNFQKFKL